MSTKITRINQIAKEKPKAVFTSIYHLIDYELLNECFHELDGNKATGLDKVTKAKYVQLKAAWNGWLNIPHVLYLAGENNI